MKYLAAIAIALLVVVLTRIIFAYFGYESEFLVGWFGATGYFITLEIAEKTKQDK